MRRLLLFALSVSAVLGQTRIVVDRPVAPPAWALAERALLKANAEGAAEFAAKYTDDRGYLRCVEQWGGNDGPDDAMENFHNWPLLYALGGPEPALHLYEKIWEGNIEQYTRARVPGVEMARDGMYYKEFITSFDWEHTGEGLTPFFFYGLARPYDRLYVQRSRRFAGLYMNEDPEAPNYDPKHRIIRSLHNGSRGPKLTPASTDDWAGRPVPGHPELHERYRAASNIRGDHPLNLCATTLAFNAYALTGERTEVRPSIDVAAPLVGRWMELSRLDLAYQSSRLGRTEVVMVAGEPGIGKTRLLSEFIGLATSAEDGATTSDAPHQPGGAPRVRHPAHRLRRVSGVPTETRGITDNQLEVITWPRIPASGCKVPAQI